MANQQIEGNNNVQVGRLDGDLIVEPPTPFMREDDPNVVPCPFQCGQRTWWNAPGCWNCGRPVLAFFQQQARNAQKERLTKAAVISGLIGLVLAMGSQYLPSGISGVALVVGVLGILGFAALGSQADRLK